MRKFAKIEKFSPCFKFRFTSPSSAATLLLASSMLPATSPSASSSLSLLSCVNAFFRLNTFDVTFLSSTTSEICVTELRWWKTGILRKLTWQEVHGIKKQQLGDNPWRVTSGWLVTKQRNSDAVVTGYRSEACIRYSKHFANMVWPWDDAACWKCITHGWNKSRNFFIRTNI